MVYYKWDMSVIFLTFRPYDVISGLIISVTNQHCSTTNSVGLTRGHD